LIIAEHNFEALDEPYWHDLGTLLDDGGLVAQNFGDWTKEKQQEVGHFASLSRLPDNAENFCLHRIQNMERFYDKYIVGVGLACTTVFERID
jgi:hypothetical protein